MKRLIRLLFLFSVSCFLFPDCAFAQSLGFWNVENLFDTIDTPLHDDRDFTPRGRYRWDTERYRTKIANIARVLDAMNLDVVGLCEVEGQGVLRDLIEACATDYAYIWLPTGDPRGIDQALLYKGDRFFPDTPKMIRSGTSRGFLHVAGELAGERVDLVVCHMPSQLNARASRERAMEALTKFVARLETPIVMGDMNAVPDDRVLSDFPLALPPFEGEGSYAWDGRWLLYDQIRVGDALVGRVAGSSVLIRDYLLQSEHHPRPGYPLRSFSGRTYLGGYSDHLPVFLYLLPLQNEKIQTK